MKFGLVMLLLIGSILAGFAQPTARQITKKIVPPPTPAAPAEASKKTQTTPAPSTATKPSPPVVREKTKEEKEEILKKTIEFQKQRAASGSATAQYDLALRYLNGDGVEKNLETAQKWFGEAAKQGHSGAIKKLEELKAAKP